MTTHGSIADSRTWKAGVAHLKKKDKTLARLIAKQKIPKIELWDDYYESLMQSIVYQQISGKAGDAIIKKFKALYGGKLPTPKRFLATKEKKVRAAGISPQKYSYLLDLCTRIEDGRLELKKFDKMDNERIIEELDEVRGIGRWTAEMFLMFSLGRTDVFPMDDLGIRKAMQHAYGLRALPDKKKMAELSREWKPYGTIASLYLWRSKDKGEGWG